MSSSQSKLLRSLLDRLYTALIGGPSLNCRPHNSRQRMDLSLVAELTGTTPQGVLAEVLGPERRFKRSVRWPRAPGAGKPEVEWTEEERAAQLELERKGLLLRRLRTIADDARTYEQDTGAHVLDIGFPLLSIPPGAGGGGPSRGTRRILAPAAFVRVNLALSTGPSPSLELSALGEGSELLLPNTALFSWIEQQTGKRVEAIFTDDEGVDPWREVGEILTFLARSLDLDPVPAVSAETQLVAAPRSASEEEAAPRIVPAAVLGLFPLSNQSLVHDMQALAGGEALQGPIQRFVHVHDHGGGASQAPPPPSRSGRFQAQRLVTAADPCQSRAVRLSGGEQILVVHGPPGTGKSQTIANMVGEHLSRGERVLVVCEKRGALDVVHHRLGHLGLAELCAVIHDPEADQRALYLSIREQLDALAERTPPEEASAALSAADQELAALHAELSAYADELGPEGGSPSLHELAGRWLTLEARRPAEHPLPAVAQVPLSVLEAQRQRWVETWQRAHVCVYHRSPWVECLGLTLDTFLERTLSEWRQELEEVDRAAGEVDGRRVAELPAFPQALPPTEVGRAWGELGQHLGEAISPVELSVRRRWAQAPEGEFTRAHAALREHETWRTLLRSSPLEAELAQVVASSPLSMEELLKGKATLEGYLQIAPLWYGFLYLGVRREARALLARFGLPLTAEAATRLKALLLGLQARALLTALCNSQLQPDAPLEALDDARLLARLDGHERMISLRATLAMPLYEGLEPNVRQALVDDQALALLCGALAAAPGRGEALAALQRTLQSTALLSERFRLGLLVGALRGKEIGELPRQLLQRMDQLEGVARTESGLKALPTPLAECLKESLAWAPDVDRAWSAVEQAVLLQEVLRRCRARPHLLQTDLDRLDALSKRFHELSDAKKLHVLSVVKSLWIGRQRSRLLAGTGSRLNAAGAELRRRLFLKGKRALRLRQVVHIGRSMEGGDPLFDLRPVWMASPLAVAQIFPREPLFDLVIFDEASQCRLEEALPVLCRARRVVIAGDPRQLPPTRFFESAYVQSEDEALETEQQLFDAQQGEADDLLSAALGLSVEQCYLDVHYRSRHAALIGFSNQSFYERRLQPIPGYPRPKPPPPPMELVHVGGTYDKRQNLQEAHRVVELVKGLLSRSEPPTLGVASFNQSQRDLILELLDKAAAEDARFAGALATARERQGAGSFEGLFVKNLENVQGDERDVIIISTTYGPDPEGRFYRRFGPLGREGGGRRLNVLVTRAREAIYVVTSIPEESYRNLPPIPAGQTPTGGYLLLAYLRYVEAMAREGLQPSAAPGAPAPAPVQVWPSRAPSGLATGLAHHLARHRKISSSVHWGNDGFCVDVALHHPDHPEAATVGVLVDGSRFSQTDDPVEWDLFRTRVLSQQGWELIRVWTPHLVRDPEGTLKRIAARHAGLLTGLRSSS